MEETVFLFLFPLFFIGMWLLVTTMLGTMSGWTDLQDKFEDKFDQRPLKRLRMRSGMLGSGSVWNPWGNVQYSNCLTLDACQSGLRISLWKVFGPFLRPIFVPWQQIEVTSTRILFFPCCRLELGNSGRFLTVGRWTMNALGKASGGQLQLLTE